MNDDFKVISKTLSGIGKVEISILQMGDNWYLKELEDFVTKSDENFYALSRMKTELILPIHMQRAIQAFVAHVQSGGEKQTATLLRSHFRNWVNRQNGTLKNIINAEQPTTGKTESQQFSREGVQSEFDRRYGSKR